MIENPGGGGGVQEGDGAEGPGGCLQRIGEFFLGGGLIFFFGAKTSTKVWFHAPLRVGSVVVGDESGGGL